MHLDAAVRTPAAPKHDTLWLSLEQHKLLAHCLSSVSAAMSPLSSLLAHGHTALLSAPGVGIKGGAGHKATERVPGSQHHRGHCSPSPRPLVLSAVFLGEHACCLGTTTTCAITASIILGRFRVHFCLVCPVLLYEIISHQFSSLFRHMAPMAYPSVPTPFTNTMWLALPKSPAPYS